MGNVLVTGGLGFIGSHFVDLLVDDGTFAGIRVVDANTYCGSQKNLARHQTNRALEIIDGSITDARTVEKVMMNVDAVVHFAAESHVDNSIINPKPFFETNVMGTLNILEACRELSVKRIVVISTDEVYGSTAGPVTENHAPGPMSPYAASKASMDLLTQSYWHTYGLPACIVRPTNNYGPRQFPEKLIPKFILAMGKGVKVPVYGEGNNTREWMYVGDTCRAIMALLNRDDYCERVAGEVFNVGSGERRNVLEITGMLCSLLGMDKNNCIENVNDRAGHVKHHQVDTSKLKTLTKWEPSMALEQGLKDTVKWYQQRQGEVLNSWWK